MVGPPDRPHSEGTEVEYGKLGKCMGGKDGVNCRRFRALNVSMSWSFIFSAVLCC